jgi:hypothetical protein
MVGNIREFLKESGWNFVKSRPKTSAFNADEPYCMIPIHQDGAGDEWVCYFTSGGTKTLSPLPANEKYRVRWWNPRDGGFPVTQTRSSTANGTLQAPSPGGGPDWVLYVRRLADPG